MYSLLLLHGIYTWCRVIDSIGKGGVKEPGAAGVNVTSQMVWVAFHSLGNNAAASDKLAAGS